MRAISWASSPTIHSAAERALNQSRQSAEHSRPAAIRAFRYLKTIRTEKIRSVSSADAVAQTISRRRAHLGCSVYRRIYRARPARTARGGCAMEGWQTYGVDRHAASVRDRDELARRSICPRQCARHAFPTWARYGGKHTGEAAIEAARLSRPPATRESCVDPRRGIHLGLFPPCRPH